MTEVLTTGSPKMKAQIAREGEIVIVSLSGHIDVETAVPFRESLLKPLLNQKVVFDFKSLSFVGSSGILPFIETIQEFAEKSRGRIKFSGLGSEFKKVFAATPLQAVEIHESQAQAVQSLLNPKLSQAMQAHVVATAAPMHSSHFDLRTHGDDSSVGGSTDEAD